MQLLCFGGQYATPGRVLVQQELMSDIAKLFCIVNVIIFPDSGQWKQFETKIEWDLDAVRGAV